MCMAIHYDVCAVYHGRTAYDVVHDVAALSDVSCVRVCAVRMRTPCVLVSPLLMCCSLNGIARVFRLRITRMCPPANAQRVTRGCLPACAYPRGGGYGAATHSV